MHDVGGVFAAPSHILHRHADIIYRYTDVPEERTWMVTS